MAISGTPSLAFAICHQGEPLKTFHLGFRDIEHKLKSNDQTRFNINSMTKGMVSALTGIEVSKETVDWCKSIKDALSNFSSTDAVAEDNATVIDMLSHRSGITNFDAYWLRSENSVLLARDQTLNCFSTLEKCLPFRASFNYNNWGYELVVEVLEKRAGRSMSALLHDRLFEPLAMSRTSTTWHPENDNQAKSYAVLDDITTVEIPPPKLGKGTLMEAACGVKSTI